MKKEFDLSVRINVRTEEEVPNPERLEKNLQIFEDVIEELDYATKWGDDFDEKNTLNDWISYITDYASDAGRMRTPIEKSRELFIKAAGLCFSAIKAIDNGGPAPRHYDK